MHLNELHDTLQHICIIIVLYRRDTHGNKHLQLQQQEQKQRVCLCVYAPLLSLTVGFVFVFNPSMGFLSLFSVLVLRSV